MSRVSLGLFSLDVAPQQWMVVPHFHFSEHIPIGFTRLGKYLFLLSLSCLGPFLSSNFSSYFPLSLAFVTLDSVPKYYSTSWYVHLKTKVQRVRSFGLYILHYSTSFRSPPEDLWNDPFIGTPQQALLPGRMQTDTVDGLGGCSVEFRNCADKLYRSRPREKV